MDKKEVLILIAETLEINSNSITMDTILSEIPQWDSMAKLSLTILFSDNFNIKIDNTIIKSFITIGDIVRAVK